MVLAVLGLVLAGATNVLIAVTDAVTWPWWLAAGCLAVAWRAGHVWSRPFTGTPGGVEGVPADDHASSSWRVSVGGSPDGRT
ncbi:hypothetical protein [Saccharothrix sp.]|uniref:hypothetical protein n=1 Tax=Saccharothrix sp. TaxID=1873460 RepID=UPI0028112E9E|nr:hypothetical protein [Saccharothrix sp.]